MEAVFLIGRILFAAMFINSGIAHLTKLTPMSQYAASQKLPAPKLAVALSGLMILAGGLSILLGGAAGRCAAVGLVPDPDGVSDAPLLGCAGSDDGSESDGPLHEERHAGGRGAAHLLLHRAAPGGVGAVVGTVTGSPIATAASAQAVTTAVATQGAHPRPGRACRAGARRSRPPRSEPRPRRARRRAPPRGTDPPAPRPRAARPPGGGRSAGTGAAPRR